MAGTCVESFTRETQTRHSDKQGNQYMENNVESKTIPPEQIVRGAYEVIVVGAGHAGCEAALASARMGRKTLLLTMNLDSVALMPCNPSMGGPAKGHLIKEIDALGGEIGRNTDRTFIQIRLLNTRERWSPAHHRRRHQQWLAIRGRCRDPDHGHIHQWPAGGG